MLTTEYKTHNYVRTADCGPRLKHSNKGTTMEKVMTIKVRVWLYGIGIGIGGVCLVYGVLTAEQLVAWLGLLAAILAVTAVSNVGEKGLS